MLPAWYRAPIVLLLCSSVGCITSRPVVEFPSLLELEEIAKHLPRTSLDIESIGRLTKSWQIESKAVANTSSELWQENGLSIPISSAVRAHFHQPLSITKNMVCIAAEIGKFRATHKKQPPHDLQYYINGACGAVATTVQSSHIIGKASSSVNEAEIIRIWSELAATKLVSKLSVKDTDFGFWLTRTGEEVLLQMTYIDKTSVNTKKFSFNPDDAGNIVIEGQIWDGASHFSGLVNRGEFGVEECIVDPSVAPPHFRIMCTMSPDDQTSWVELFYTRPHRVLARSFIRFLARRPSDDPYIFSWKRPAAQPVLRSSEEFSNTIMAELNRVRNNAHLTPVTLAGAQSTMATRLAPSFFTNSDGVSAEENDERIAQGLLAGWQINGMIRSGNFFSEWIPFANDPDTWLQTALLGPAGRAALLSSHVEQVALGPLLLSQPDRAGVLATGYRLHHGNDHSEDAARLFARTVAARRLQKAEAPRRLNELRAFMEAALKRVYLGQIEPIDARDQILTKTREIYNQPASGFVLETTSLDQLQIDEDIIKQPHLFIDYGVTHHKPAGGAWAQFVVIAVWLIPQPASHQDSQ